MTTEVTVGVTPDINAAAYPAGFTPPPGFPIPTEQDIASAAQPTGAGLVSTPAASSSNLAWWLAGGAAVLGAAALGYWSYRRRVAEEQLYQLNARAHPIFDPSFTPTVVESM